MWGFAELVSGCLVEPDRSGQGRIVGDVADRGSVTLDEARLLSALACGRDVCELGTGCGVSAAAMARTARSVVTVDPDPFVDCVVLPATVRRVRDRAELGDARYSLVFIDAEHSFQSVSDDLAWSKAHLVDGGLIVLHDVGQTQVEGAVVEFRPSFRFSYDTVGKLTVVFP